MKATNFPLQPPGSLGAWIGFSRSPKSTARAKVDGATSRRPGFLERLDRWLWRAHVREHEAYLAQSRDIYELEERIRRVERAVGSRYY